MRITVQCRRAAGVMQPCRFCLGQARHRVVAIAGERRESDAEMFEVRVLDGRRFVLSHRLEPDRWVLAAVHARKSQRPTRPLELHRNRSVMFLHATGLLLAHVGPALWRLAHRRTKAAVRPPVAHA